MRQTHKSLVAELSMFPGSQVVQLTKSGRPTTLVQPPSLRYFNKAQQPISSPSVLLLFFAMALTHCNFPRLVIAVICTFIILGLILHSKPEAVPSLEQLKAIAQEYRYFCSSIFLREYTAYVSDPHGTLQARQMSPSEKRA
jgi:hypothetical protein